jgi:PAS domain S-box-containing protein
MPAGIVFPVPPGPRVRGSIFNPFAVRGQVHSYALIAGIFVVLLIVALTTSWTAIEVVNDTRAYATGEGRYSKAEKMAVLDLHRYVDSRDEADYRAFLRDIDVPRGDRDARIALSSPVLDLQVATDGMLRGQNHPDDVGGLIRLFRWFSRWKPFAKAVDDWRTADDQIARLMSEAAQLHTRVAAGHLNGARLQVLARIDSLDRAVTDRENTFSTHMGEAARQATFLVVAGLGGLTIVLWAIGIIFTARLFRRQVALDEKLGNSERRFRDYAEVASDWYWEMDRNNLVTYLSGRFEDIVGAPAERVIGSDVSEVILRGAQDPIHRQKVLASIAARQPFRGLTLQFKGSDGKYRYCAISAKPHADNDGEFEGYRGTGADITSQMHATQNLRAAKGRAEAANRAKSEFLANMSHELRTPLNAILGFSDIIAQRLFGTQAVDRYSDYARDIHRSGTHLLAIINDILDLSKIEAGHTTLEESDMVLAAMVPEVRRLLGNRLSLSAAKFFVTVPKEIVVRMDERKFVQILINLLSNALKFTPADGSVTLSAAIEDDGGIAVSVRDTGIGIAAGDIETVLSPFGQVESVFSRKHHGTGLGVPLAKSLVELHDGSLTIESVEGAGTTVTVRLPSSRVLPPALPVSRAFVA